MARELRLVEGDVLDADAGLVAVDLDDLVDQEEGIAVRQELQNLHDIGGLKRGGRFGHGLNSGRSWMPSTNVTKTRRRLWRNLSPDASFFRAVISRNHSRIGRAGMPPQRAPGRNVAVDAAGRGDLRAHADPHMALHGNLAADSDEVLDGRGAGDADLGDDHAMAPDHHVVGDLDQVIDLRALADHRIAARAAVDGGVGADLHVVLDDHAPDLRHLQMPLRSHGEAEAVLADAHAGMEDDPVADEGVGNGHVGGDRAVPADLHLGADHGMGADQGAGADLRMRADDGAGIDPDPVLQPGRRMDEGARRDARRGEGGFRPHRGREQEAPAPARRRDRPAA